MVFPVLPVIVLNRWGSSICRLGPVRSFAVGFSLKYRQQASW